MTLHLGRLLLIQLLWESLELLARTTFSTAKAAPLWNADNSIITILMVFIREEATIRSLYAKSGCCPALIWPEIKFHFERLQSLTAFKFYKAAETDPPLDTDAWHSLIIYRKFIQFSKPLNETPVRRRGPTKKHFWFVKTQQNSTRHALAGKFLHFF